MPRDCTGKAHIYGAILWSYKWHPSSSSCFTTLCRFYFYYVLLLCADLNSFCVISESSSHIVLYCSPVQRKNLWKPMGNIEVFFFSYFLAVCSPEKSAIFQIQKQGTANQKTRVTVLENTWKYHRSTKGQPQLLELVMWIAQVSGPHSLISIQQVKGDGLIYRHSMVNNLMCVLCHLDVIILISSSAV